MSNHRQPCTELLSGVLLWKNETRTSHVSQFTAPQRPDGIMRPSLAIDICFQEKYFTFSGRATRSEFWFFFVFASVLSSIINFVLLFVGDFFREL